MSDNPAALDILLDVGLETSSDDVIRVERCIFQKQSEGDHEESGLSWSHSLNPNDHLDLVAAGWIFLEFGCADHSMESQKQRSSPR